MTTLNKLLDEAKSETSKLRLTCKDGAQIGILLLVNALKSRTGPVRVSGLGTFKVVKLKARTYRHPKTGKRCDVGPRTVVRFKPSAKLNF